MNKKQICIIHQCGTNTGIDRHIDEQANLFATYGDLEVTVVVNQYRKNLNPELKQLIVKSLPFSVPGFRALWMLFLYFYLWRNKFDLVYGMHYSIWSPIKLDFLWKNTKIIFLINDTMWNNHYNRYKISWLFYRLVFFPCVLRCSDHFLTISSSSKSDIINYTGLHPDKIDVSLLGVSKKFTKLNRSRTKYIKAIVNNNHYILNVGKIKRTKNIHNIINAFYLLKKTHPDLKLIFTGQLTQDNYGKELMQLMQTNNIYAKDIIFLDYVNEKKLVELYSFASCFCMPSLGEGFGLPLLEAMACGIPTITSCISAMPQVAGDAALFCDPFDITDISKQIQKVLQSDRLRKRLIKSGYQRTNKLTWDSSVEELRSIFLTQIEKI